MQSYQIQAFYYQLKPISRDDFFHLMDSILVQLEKQQAKSLLLSCKNGITRIKPEQLEYCEVIHRTLLTPLLYYVFDYTSTVYTNLLSNGEPVFVEFMPFVCCAAYLSFLLYNSTVEHSRNELRETQKTLSIQLKQAVREIDSLRESQTLASQYRHDMRHHLQYVSTCIKNGQEELAFR